MLGILENKKGRKDVAKQLIKKAISINPDIPAYYNNLGEIYRSERQYQNAISNYQQAITLNQNYAQAYNNLGCVLVEVDKVEDAVDSFNMAISSSGNNYADAYSNLGNVLADQGKLNDALSSYNKAIKVNSRHKDAFNKKKGGQVFLFA